MGSSDWREHRGAMAAGPARSLLVIRGAAVELGLHRIEYQTAQRDVWSQEGRASPNQPFQADRDPRERGPRPLNSNR